MEVVDSPAEDPALAEETQSLSLSAAKQLRRKAEEDATMLANRIALLKEEESRALKKIDETRRRAREIMEKKMKADLEKRQKEEEKKARDEELKVKAEHLRMLKEERKAATNSARESVLQRLKTQVQLVRESKAQCQELIEKENHEVLLEKSRVTQKLKDQQHEAKRKRELDEYERQARFKAELSQRTQSELQRKRELDEQISNMEAEELELINRLQNTQMMHKTALQELEEASSRPLAPIVLEDVTSK